MTLVAEIGDSKDNGRMGREGGRGAEVGVGRTSWHSGRIIEPASSLRGSRGGQAFGSQKLYLPHLQPSIGLTPDIVTQDRKKQKNVRCQRYSTQWGGGPRIPLDN